MGRDLHRCVGQAHDAHFNPRAPYGARRARPPLRPRGDWNFNPRAPYGARPAKYAFSAALELFQSTRPIRGATVTEHIVDVKPDDFNPRAPYGARHVSLLRILWKQIISIHAPHTGRDHNPLWLFFRTTYFNPRAPYGARLHAVSDNCFSNFDFNPRAPYGARHNHFHTHSSFPGISIHAPHTGRDVKPSIMVDTAGRFQSTRPIRGATPAPAEREIPHKEFQSTRPIRGATAWFPPGAAQKTISIHAPHTGRDSKNA